MNNEWHIYQVGQNDIDNMWYVIRIHFVDDKVAHSVVSGPYKSEVLAKKEIEDILNG